MDNYRKVSVRELAHNLSEFLELAKSIPIIVTKYGSEKVVMIDPSKFEITKKKNGIKTKKDLSSFKFIGMHKDRKDWKGKKSSDIANKLRSSAWYGK